MPDQAAVGFVGIGAMGWPMAANLVRRQFPVTVYDLDRARQDRFVQAHQSRAASSLADLGKDAAVIVTMLPTGRDVREVLLTAEDGALANALKPGAIVVDMSSSDPAGTRELAGILVKRGVILVDAPVSGGTRGAEAASLTIMIGSDDKAAVERVRPVLEAMGQRLFATGGSGTGHAMKALNNFIAGTNFLAAAEALVVGKRFGLEPALMVEIINQSTGRSFSSEHVLPQHVLSRKFASGFQLGLLAKDVKIAADLADDLQADAPVARLSRDLLALARDRLGATADHSAAIQYWELLNGVTVGGEPEK
jgi:3-hydroxyisobutyrate dehydrogenase